jgi:hypothetical protein
LTVTGQVSIASLGLNKGVVETGNDPQIFLGLRARRDDFFVTAKARNTLNALGAVNQQEVATGYLHDFGDMQLDLHVAVKINGGMHGPGSRYVEWEAEFTRKLGPWMVGRVQLDATQDPGYVETDLWADLNLNAPLGRRWRCVGALGYRRSESRHYVAGDLGLGYVLSPRTSLDMRVFDTNRHDLGERFHPHLVLKITQKL